MSTLLLSEGFDFPRGQTCGHRVRRKSVCRNRGCM